MFVPSTITKTLLTVNNLTLSISRQRVLHDVNFSIHPGKIVALVGESGSGKSMTALSIMRLLPKEIDIPSSAQIIFQDQDLLALDERTMRKYRGSRISMIFQEPMTSLNPVMSVQEQLIEILSLYTSLSLKEKQKKVIQLLKEVGISDPCERQHAYPHQLSGGMKQRVMIAMAIACEPDLLIADEPTTALDVTIQAQILHLLKKLQRKKQMAILLITHDLAIVKQFADYVLVMREGKIVEQAESQVLFQAPAHEYTKLLLNAMPHWRDHSFNLSNSLKEKGMDPLLKAEWIKVYFSFRSHWWKKKRSIKAVDDVNINLYPGKTLAILGESGCGKTTLAKALVGLVDCKGKIVSSTINIQMVFQDPQAALNPRLVVLELMREALQRQKKSRKEKLIFIEEILRKVGLDNDALQRYPHQFSGGQRQRINIARALVAQPNILILDEPTSALDVSIQIQILQLLQFLQKSFNLSYLLISHNIDVVAFLADEIAIMYLGKIVEQGTVMDVLTQPKHPYTQLLLSLTPTDFTHVELPSPLNTPQGCHFHPRCPHAMSACRENYPKLTKLSDSHMTHCFLYQKDV